MIVENQIEKKLSAARGESWVAQAKREALAYQQSLKIEALKSKIGTRYLTRKGTIVRLRDVTPHRAVVEFPSSGLKEIQWSIFNTWIALNATSMNQLAASQQLDVQIQTLQEQKRRVNLQRRLPEDKQLVLKGLDLAIQALQNLQNPNNQE